MSPNGKWIVFGSTRDSASEGGGDIYMMKAAENETAMRITDGATTTTRFGHPTGASSRSRVSATATRPYMSWIPTPHISAE
jgi:Tol biopolymer transport system component